MFEFYYILVSLTTNLEKNYLSFNTRIFVPATSQSGNNYDVVRSWLPKKVDWEIISIRSTQVMVFFETFLIFPFSN